MPRPVFPVVRLPYDRPDRVARVLEAVRCELVASRRPQPAAPVAASPPRPQLPPTIANAMTAHVQQQSTRREEAERTSAARAATPVASPADHPTVDQVTVGVRDCTLTPKAARPDILVTAGGAAAAARNAYPADHHGQYLAAPNGGGGGGPYLLVPPVNITAEISRPPLTPLQQYMATSS